MEDATLISFSSIMNDVLIRYLHFLSIIVLIAAVFGQHLLLKSVVSRAQVKRVQRLDIVYAVMVVVVLATGFAQWLWVGKPAEFYSSNPVFHTKIMLFLVVGVISIYPSVFFGKNKKGDQNEEFRIPKSVTWAIRVELLILVLMPLLATLMAKGFGIPVVAE